MGSEMCIRDRYSTSMKIALRRFFKHFRLTLFKSLLGHFWADFDDFFAKSLLLRCSQVSVCRKIIQKSAGSTLKRSLQAKSLQSKKMF